MEGNDPYAGPLGRTNSRDVDLSAEQKDALRDAVSSIVTRTESYLPDGYAVGSELSYGANGPQATVAVRPPAGHPVSAGFQPDIENLEGLDEEDRAEVARGLAASAAAQVMNAVGDDIERTAR